MCQRNSDRYNDQLQQLPVKKRFQGRADSHGRQLQSLKRRKC